MANKRKAHDSGRRRGAEVDKLQQQEDDLVASLFGGTPAGKRIKTAPSAPTATTARRSDGVEQDGQDGDDDSDDPWTGLEHVDNGQLFSVDGGLDSQESDEEDGEELEDLSEIDYEAESEEEEEDVEEQKEEETATRRTSSAKREPSGRKKAAWTDTDDAQLVVALAGANSRAADGSFVGTKRLRKLRQHADEKEVSGLEYEARLRKIFEKLHPRPSWASRTRKGDIDYSMAIPPASTDALLLSELLSRDSGLVARATGQSKVRARLMPDGLEMERLRNANESQGRDDDAAVESIGFHPTSNANILMSATRNRKVRLFQIDGKANPLLHTINLPDLTLQTALFHPLGTTAFFAGARPFFYTHDFITGTTTRSLPWRGTVDGAYDGSEVERDLSFARFQPLHGTGNLLAIGGKRGTIHLLDWGNSANSASGTTGRGSLVGSLRMNAPLVGMAWDPSDSAGGNRLVTLSKEGRAHVWDIRNMRCEAVRLDLGLYSPKGLEVSPTSILSGDSNAGNSGSSHAWLVGSEGGIVSVYDDKFAAVGGDVSATSASGGVSASSAVVEVPNFTSRETMSARKTVDNLTTAITTMKFNHDGQICAVASRNKKDSLKVLHTSTLRVFPNWPTSGTPLHHVTAIDFSRRGEYAAIGNSKGRVLLYEVKHYAS